MGRSRLLIAAGLLAASSAGCERGPGPGAGSEGVAPRWTVADTPFLVIGGITGDPATELGEPLSPILLSDGRTAIPDRMTSEIKYFGPDGSLERLVGGRGEGPQEFSYLYQTFRLPGDSILMIDMPIRRMSWIDPQGRVVRRESMRQEEWPSLKCTTTAGGWALGPEGIMLVAYEPIWSPAGCPPLPQGAHRGEVVVYLIDREGEADSLGVFPGSSRVGGSYQIFGGRHLQATGREHVFLADNLGDSILVFGLDGVRRATLHVPAERRPLTQEIIEARERRYRELNAENWGSENERRLAEMEYPDLMPALGGMLVGPDDELWVQEYRNPYTPPTEERWWVLTPSGEMRGERLLPPIGDVVAVGRDHVVIRELDEYDVPSFAYYRVEGR